MAEAEILILLRSIDARLGSVEARLGGVEARLGGVEARLGAVETRLDSLETRLDSLETRLAGVETRLDALETITARAPDLRLIGHQMATLIERVTGLEASNTRAIAALNDIARESVTPGEVEALHSEMNEMRNAKFNHEVRIRQLEAELHIAPSGSSSSPALHPAGE